MSTSRQREVEAGGITPDEAFAILGDKTRLDIIRALWHFGAHHSYDDVFETDSSVSFSELRRAVDIRDNGQFNYHLSRLMPHFVRQTDEGYRLSGAGKILARTVISIAGEGEFEVRDGISTTCPMCDAPVIATYEDQWLRFTCTACEGAFGETAPEGTFYASEFPAGGLADRTADEAYEVGFHRCMLDLLYLMRGICRECAGPITTELTVCDDHDVAGSFCEVCGLLEEAWIEHRCETCRFAKCLPIEFCVLGLTPVISYFERRDIDVLAPSVVEVESAIEEHVRLHVTTEPRRVTVTLGDEMDGLKITFDGEANLIECTVFDDGPNEQTFQTA